ncbi:hypothetical protein C8A05DRAFT_37429 [Staphylotrichum tortipilum]|uniref:Uncharacterized protein n=1 Tax=Staphylotrichum tortipilum TaxID=2831512 RepID=A0AAN6MFE6_9PEZI|nr:hypothetical protein C8A05DRAFT_37429 [Staphylotrichum longicolle]
MVDAAKAPSGAASAHASAEVIYQEFLKVLARMEPEQASICTKICACGHLYRYQHYYLPCWEWGVKKMVCLNMGSLRHVRENGGPFPPSATTVTATTSRKEPSYRAVLRDEALRDRLKALPLSLNDPLQSMLRHMAALDVAMALTICGAPGGVEYERVKTHFKRLCAINDGDEGQVKKLGKKPKMEGGWVEVWYAGGYTATEREALEKVGQVLEGAGAGALRVVEGEWEGEVGAKTMVDEARILRDEYVEYKQDPNRMPHPIGPAQLYLRQDVVKLTARDNIVPPYPVNFPPDYPHKHENWYLDKLPRNGRGTAVGRS